MDARLMFPSLYLQAADLRGRDVVLTIDHVQVEDLQRVGGKKDRKAVVHFRYPDTHQGERKRLVMNKTNAHLIAAALGTYEVTEWPGRRIALHPDRCQAPLPTGGHGEVDCIRVRPSAPDPVGPPAGDVWDELAAEGGPAKTPKGSTE